VPESAFSAGNVMKVTVTGLKEAQARLNRAQQGVQPQGLERAMRLATGQVHRYLLSIGRSGTPPTTQGVLPVVTGRLRASFFWQVRRHGSGAVSGVVGSNVEYGPVVNQRRQFLQRVVRDQERPVQNIVGAYIRQVTR